MRQNEPPRLGSTICYGQKWARKSHHDSEMRVTAKSGAERATKTRQHDLLPQKVGQKEPSRTRGYDFLKLRVSQQEPPRLGSDICYGQEWARKEPLSTAKSEPKKNHQDPGSRVGQNELPRVGSVICYGKKWARTRQYDLLRPRVFQKEPPRLGSTIYCGQEWTRRPARTIRLGSTIFYGQKWARKSHQGPIKTRQDERATKTRMLRPRVGQKEPPRPGSTI